METEREEKTRRLIISIIQEKVPKEFPQLGRDEVEELVRLRFSGDARMRKEFTREEFCLALASLIRDGSVFQVGDYWLRCGIIQRPHERSASMVLR